MGVFDDHKLEQLDWMTQMTETIDSYLNTVLARLPDRTLISAKDIIERDSYSLFSFSVREFLNKFIKENCADLEQSLSWDEQYRLEKCFKFELSDYVIELDMKNNSLQGEVSIVKIVHTLSDEELLPLMGRNGIKAIGNASHYSRADAPPAELERLNEVLDILGKCNDAMRSRSGRKKAIKIKERLGNIFETNEWRIRDMALADKVGRWIRGYIDTGNLADLTNLCKLKVMTHNSMPIYSVKEEQ